MSWLQRPTIGSRRYYVMCFAPVAIFLIAYPTFLYLLQKPAINTFIQFALAALFWVWWYRFVDWAQGYRETIFSSYDLDQPYVIRWPSNSSAPPHPNPPAPKP
jgi:hypothetical protein